MILHNITVSGKPIDGFCRERNETLWRKRLLTTRGAERVLKKEGRIASDESVVRISTLVDRR